MQARGQRVKYKAPLKSTFNLRTGWIRLPWGDTTYLRAITHQIILLLKRTDEKGNRLRETRRQEETETLIKWEFLNVVGSERVNDSKIELRRVLILQCLNTKGLIHTLTHTHSVVHHIQDPQAHVCQLHLWHLYCVLTDLSISCCNPLCISLQHALDQGEINFTYITDVIHPNELRRYPVGTKYTKEDMPISAFCWSVVVWADCVHSVRKYTNLNP